MNSIVRFNGACLVDTTHVLQENAAGAAVRSLVQKEWRSETTVSMKGKRSQSRTFRGFHGTYDIILTDREDVIWKTSVNLEKGKDIFMDIDV